MTITLSLRVQKRRSALRLAGLRPVQIWVPDTKRQGFAKECKRQSKLVSRSDMADKKMLNFMDEILSDFDDEAI